jgi:hypothetical protein
MVNRKPLRYVDIGRLFSAVQRRPLDEFERDALVYLAIGAVVVMALWLGVLA